MATGWEALGTALAGGPPDTNASLHSAQTQEALARAAIARNKYEAQTGLAGVDPNALTPAQRMQMIQSGYGSDAAAMQEERLRGQQFGFRNTVAAPETSDLDRFHNLEAISGTVQNPIAKTSAETYIDLREPGTTVNQTPLGAELVKSEEAQTAQRTAAANASDRSNIQKPLAQLILEEYLKGAVKPSAGATTVDAEGNISVGGTHQPTLDEALGLISQAQAHIPQTPAPGHASATAPITDDDARMAGLVRHHNANNGGKQNADGSTSTLKTITVESDGKVYIVPTIWDGQEITDPQAAAQRAFDSGDIGGPFDSEAEAEAADMKLHEHWAGSYDRAAKDKPAGGLASPKTKEEMDALPSGTEFIAPDGSHRRKS